MFGRPQLLCACSKDARSCPAARRFTFWLSNLKYAKRNAIRARLKAKAPKQLLLLLRGTFGDQCEYCGRESDDWTIDRIFPGAMGGDYSAPNVTLACRSCNSMKGADSFVGPVRSIQDMGVDYHV